MFSYILSLALTNPFYGSIDGRLTAPKEIHALGNVPPGSKAVVIHPKVQERMEQDPAYAQEIFAKIDTWFAFDVARNEAIIPGSTAGMSQAVAIGEDGNICNACSSSAGGEITYSKSGSDDEESWWDLRMARHAEFMKLAVEKQIERHIQASKLAASAAAKSQLAAMLTGGNFRERDCRYSYGNRSGNHAGPGLGRWSDFVIIPLKIKRKDKARWALSFRFSLSKNGLSGFITRQAIFRQAEREPFRLPLSLCIKKRLRRSLLPGGGRGNGFPWKIPLDKSVLLQ